ncbi:MAG: carbohydrate ABC transporter permease [Bacillota bacterium]
MLCRAAVYATLTAGGMFFLLPFAWMLSTSLKPIEQIFVFPPVWLPRPVLWSNYVEAVTVIPFFRYLFNTLYISVISIIGYVLSSAVVAYGFSRIKWPGRDILFVIMLGTMLLPSQVTMVPVFVIFKTLGWIGSFKPLTVPAFFGSPFSIFLLRQFFQTLPMELSDAARVDGCSELGIFTRVMIPLLKPALATVTLFIFIWTWTDFLNPLIYLSDQRMYTLSLGLQQFQTEHGVEWSSLMAASTLVTLPIIALFFVAQKTFIQGIATTGLRG